MEPLEESFLIRYRIDGILHDAMELPKHAAAAITARIKVLANMRLDEHRLPQDGRFGAESGGEKTILPRFSAADVLRRKDRYAYFARRDLWIHARIDRIPRHGT